jgi:hypothetical protein
MPYKPDSLHANGIWNFAKRRTTHVWIFGSAAQELKLRYTKVRRRVALPGTTDSSDETYSFVRCLAWLIHQKEES